jgi:hypothetical protein
MKRVRPVFFLAVLFLFSAAASSQTISRAFVTSSFHGANMGGLAGADLICQQRAAAGGLNGVWKGWISTSSGSPSTRFTRATGAYKRIDGQVLANSWTDLTTLGLQSALMIDEFGAAINGQIYGVFTQTNADGTRYSQTGGCTNFTSTTGDALIGNATLAGPTSWTAYQIPTGVCAGLDHLYCFQDPVPPLASLSGRVVSASGRGIRHAKITVTGPGLATPREAFTGEYGNYTVASLPANVKYTITVSQRRFTFATPSRTVDLAGNISGANFTSAQ